MSRKNRRNLDEAQHFQGTHTFAVVPFPGTLYGPAAAEATFRCCKCGMRVVGIMATSRHQLMEKNIPVYCEEYLIYAVMES